MKAKDAKRAAILVRARGQLADQIERLRKPVREIYDWRGLEVQVADFEDGGGEISIYPPYAKLDAETALLALPAVIAVIDRELKNIGVMIDQEGNDEGK